MIPDHPILAMVVWIGAQIVCGVLGYFQGRKDEELRWRRVLDGDKARKIGFGGKS